MNPALLWVESVNRPRGGRGKKGVGSHFGSAPLAHLERTALNRMQTGQWNS